MSVTLTTVGLEGIRFNAAIGWFPEERIIKNNFIVDLCVTFESSNKVFNDDIANTIDYTELYNVCKQFFNIESKLIDTVGQKIINKLNSKFPFVQDITILIKKESPPIKGVIDHSFIKLSFKK